MLLLKLGLQLNRKSVQGSLVRIQAVHITKTYRQILNINKTNCAK